MAIYIVSCCEVPSLYTNCFKRYANYNSSIHHFVLPGCAIWNVVSDRNAIISCISTKNWKAFKVCVKDKFKNNTEEAKSIEKVPVCYTHNVFNSPIFMHLISYFQQFLNPFIDYGQYL